MIEPAERVPRGATLQADLCIVGAGPAGITLALSLAGKGLSVVVLEAGRRPRDPGAQVLYRGEVAAGRAHAPPHLHRLRGLGGGSTGWDGRCLPLDALDFETRAHVPYSGWPISWDGLQPYYARALGWVEAGRFDHDARTALPGAPPLLDGFASDVVRTEALDRWSPPTDFGRRYQRRLELAPDVRVVTGAHCTAVRLEPGGRNVRALDVATLAGNRFHVTARAVVLAAGALETARLLLQSDDVVPQGVGNQLGVVGRFYQCHLAGEVARLALHRPATGGHATLLAADGTPCRRRLAIAPAQQQRHGLLNAALRLEPLHDTPAAGTALAALRQAARRVRETAPTPPWLDRLLAAGVRPARARAGGRVHGFAVRVQAEQQPLPSSRVQLLPQADALGMRKLQIDWRCCLADVASVAGTLSLLDAELQRTGAGRLAWDRDRLQEDLLRDGARAGHHIGTARMGTDIRTSVVDTDCKLHLVGNLYVAGSAVFPTSGHADPTLTLLALTLRLADRLARRLQPRRATAEELFA